MNETIKTNCDKKIITMQEIQIKCIIVYVYYFCSSLILRTLIDVRAVSIIFCRPITIGYDSIYQLPGVLLGENYVDSNQNKIHAQDMLKGLSQLVHKKRQNIFATKKFHFLPKRDDNFIRTIETKFYNNILEGNVIQ